MNELRLKWHNYSQNIWLQEQSFLTKSTGDNSTVFKKKKKRTTVTKCILTQSIIHALIQFMILSWGYKSLFHKFLNFIWNLHHVLAFTHIFFCPLWFQKEYAEKKSNTCTHTHIYLASKKHNFSKEKDASGILPMAKCQAQKFPKLQCSH